tara:strand:+ start:734 stop:1138 length:405 start_codon:yes stop_codon:yes gene_type:complete
MSKQNEMMAKALKEYMQMRADDIEEVYEIMSIEDVKTRNARQDKYIEDTLNNVFARNMPELHEQEEYRGMDAETIYNKLKGETKLKKSLKRLTNHVYREYGARCDEYEPTCIVCKTWACIDHLKETIKPKGETK